MVLTSRACNGSVPRRELWLPPTTNHPLATNYVSLCRCLICRPGADHHPQLAASLLVHTYDSSPSPLFHFINIRATCSHTLQQRGRQVIKMYERRSRLNLRLCVAPACVCAVYLLWSGIFIIQKHHHSFAFCYRSPLQTSSRAARATNKLLMPHRDIRASNKKKLWIALLLFSNMKVRRWCFRTGCYKRFS
jgi:hypothetical protein